jgi:hypothetical protein
LNWNIGLSRAEYSRTHVGSTITVPRTVMIVAEVDHVHPPEGMEQVGHDHLRPGTSSARRTIALDPGSVDEVGK